LLNLNTIFGLYMLPILPVNKQNEIQNTDVFSYLITYISDNLVHNTNNMNQMSFLFSAVLVHE